MTIYERIRQLRINNGMSQDDLARSMGYKDRSMITKIESGKVDISQKKIIAFARVLGTTPAYLMGWDDQPADPPPDPEISIVSGMMENMSKDQIQQLITLVRQLEQLDSAELLSRVQEVQGQVRQFGEAASQASGFFASITRFFDSIAAFFQRIFGGGR